MITGEKTTLGCVIGLYPLAFLYCLVSGDFALPIVSGAVVLPRCDIMLRTGTNCFRHRKVTGLSYIFVDVVVSGGGVTTGIDVIVSVVNLGASIIARVEITLEELVVLMLTVSVAARWW